MEIKYFFKKLRSRLSLNKLTFEKIKDKANLYLYAGDIPDSLEYKKYIGLSVNIRDNKHIKHDLTKKHQIDDDTVDIYQSEDVFEHIAFEQLPAIINDIYRILKPGGVFRMSVPDYRCDILYNRCKKDNTGKILFDPLDGKTVNGGHLWFPNYESVLELLNKTSFKNIVFYHYYDTNGNGITNKIDYSIGFIRRTPDNDERVKNPYRPLSIVVDCIK